jgi:uncharacterized membrane protein
MDHRMSHGHDHPPGPAAAPAQRPRPGGRRAAATPVDAVPVPQHPPAGQEFVPGRFIRPQPAAAPRPATAPASRALTGVVIAVALLHLLGLAWLWPRGPAPTAPGATAVYAGVAFTQGTVRQVISKPCPGTTDTRLPDGSIPAVTTCITATVLVNGGPQAGTTVTVGVPTEVARTGLAPGVRVQLARYPPVPGAPVTWVFLDYARDIPLTLLAVVFAGLVIAVARLRGLLALAGLGLAFAAIAVFVLPALRHNENPILVAGISAGAIMIVILYLAHGFSTKTTTALLGTLTGIWVTAALATWATTAAHLNGLGNEDNLTLSRLTTGAGLDNLILAGIVLAGLGVLNDVTITQASAVWELRQHAPHLNARGLFTSGMRIGRDHLASTIYTIAFAYAGVALPTLLLVNLYGEPLPELINSSQIAEEIVRTLVASIGLILSIPLTTLIAALLATRTHPDTLTTTSPTTPGHSHSHAITRLSHGGPA